MGVKRLRLLLLGLALMLAGVLLAWRVQTAGGVQVRDIRFPGANGVVMSGLLYVPPNATPQRPAPGVLAVHGYINSRETQDGFAIEFARRGYVVLAMDQTGHGYSGGKAYANGFGGPDGLRYLRSLPFVDPNNIGLEGHSMGGWTVLAAALAMPDAYKAVVLEGSSTGKPFAAPGTPTWPRNLAVVYSRFDEFSKLMWGVERARDAPNSPKLQAVFGEHASIQPGRLYGSVADGTARQLYTPSTTHPGDHISPGAIGDALDWFGKTLSGGTPRPASDQIWMWKEVGTLVALVGWAVFVLGGIEALLSLRLFSPLRADAPTALHQRRSPAWWGGLIAMALVPAILLFPCFALAALYLKPSRLFPQAITNQIMVWALASAAVTLVIALVRRRAGDRAVAQRWLLSLALAVGVFALAYACSLAASLLHVDFRFWVVALKPLSARQAVIALAYFVPFTAFFSVALRALAASVPIQGESPAAAYAGSIAAMAGGFALLLGLTYGALLFTGKLMTDFDPLTTIVAIQFLPLMAFVAVLATFSWRRTGRWLPAALVSGALVTWYMVAGTATHV